MTPGDIVGHEPMGIVEEVGSDVGNLEQGDRVVLPFNVSCGHCWMCDRQLYSQCETTQNREYGTGAGFFGYSKLYGQIPGGQAEYLRVPFADFMPIKVPEGPADDRFLFLSDVLPTAWQAVQYADVPDGGTLLVMGLGPIGDMSAPDRSAPRLPGHRRRPGAGAARQGRRPGRRRHRPQRGRRRGRRSARAHRRPRRRPVIDAVGMEAHGSPRPPPADPGRLPAQGAGRSR